MGIKKLCEYFIRYMLAITIVVSCFLVSPDDVDAASSSSEPTTLAELRQELAKLQKKKKDLANQKAWTQAEKNKKNQEILNAKDEITNSENQITLLKQEIENTKVKIEELNKQTEDLMKFYQEMVSSNAYLEFVSESSSMTDLIMRIDAVKKLSEFNKNKLEEMENLIKSNEQKNVDLVNYEKQLNSNIASYEKKIEELDTSLLNLVDIGVDINDEIDIVTKNINHYKSLGCGENQKFTECAKFAYNGTWLKPVNSGMVTSLFGLRTLNGKTGSHSGIDIGVPEKTPVYSATNGKVVYLVNSSNSKMWRCGGYQVYIESVVDGKVYVMLYAHLLSYNVSLYQSVTNQTIIGYSGGHSTSAKYGGYDTCTFGAHLHYSVSEGNWTNWATFYKKLINPPGFPGKGVRFYSRTQWFK